MYNTLSGQVRIMNVHLEIVRGVFPPDHFHVGFKYPYMHNFLKWRRTILTLLHLPHSNPQELPPQDIKSLILILVVLDDKYTLCLEFRFKIYFVWK